MAAKVLLVQSKICALALISLASFSELRAADIVLNANGDMSPTPILVSIISRLSGRCLDITGGATVDGTKVQQWKCDASDKQKFWLTPAGDHTYVLKTKSSGRCLDVIDIALGDNAKLQQWNCHGGTNQSLRVLSVDATSFKLQFVHSGKCLSAVDTKDGTLPAQATCSSADSQQWHFKG